jgi:uncharacterized membrane protein YhaH (DUF805 family)
MNFTEAISSGFQNYANFSGRAQRSAFWYWVLFCFLAGLVTAGIDYAIFGGESYMPINSLFTLATIIPNLAVAARRLHDIDRTGWWQLLHFIPLIGTIVLIVWWASRGMSGPNRFGQNPLGE